MIEIIREALSELDNKFAPRADLINAYFGRELVIDAFSDDETFYHLKLADTPHLEKEFEAMREAHIALGSIAPCPLKFAVIGEWHVIVCQGVSFEPLTPATLRSSSDKIETGLRQYFQRGLSHFRLTDASRSHRALLLNRIDELGAERELPTLRRHLRRDTTNLVDSLPHVRQHSDFADNNLGVTRESIVIFDWEDFGVSTLPGLDLCVFIASMLEFDEDRVASLIQSGKPKQLEKIVLAFCDTYGVDRSSIATLFPYCMLEFLFLKRRLAYGSEIQKSTCNMLTVLCEMLP